MKSDLSGQPLAGGDAPASIVVTFRDGRQRRLTVSANEAAALAGAGEAVGSWYAWPRLRPRLAKLGVLVLGAWFASVFIPAVVQQWADRTKELELKQTLVTQISDTASAVTLAAVLMERQLLPEDRATRDADAKLDQAKAEARRGSSPQGRRITADEQAQIAVAARAFEVAVAAERRADQTYLNATRNRWMRESATTEAQLEAYFGRELADRWRSYAEVLRMFLRLPSNITDDDRRALRSKVLAFLHPGTKVTDDDVFPQFSDAADQLLARRLPLLDEILGANARGYSTGPRDLFHAVTVRAF